MPPYVKRDRPAKEAAQSQIRDWIKEIAKDHPNLTKGDAITLSGPTPYKAIESLEGLYSNKLYLYETNKKIYISARDRLAYHGKPSNVKLSKTNIYNKLHNDCTCFYYDLCCSHMNVDYKSIFEETNNQVAKNKDFSIIFTLGLRGRKNVTKELTKKAMNNFKRKLKRKYSNYKIKSLDPIIYHGGKNNKGTPMYTWALALVNEC